MKLDKSPFVIISVIGQELLAQGKYNNAVEVLESALKIGTCSLKLRGSGKCTIQGRNSLDFFLARKMTRKAARKVARDGILKGYMY